jgi:hypothetical protein
MLLLTGSFAFAQLGGKNAFPHYQLPWLFSMIFATWMIGHWIILHSESQENSQTFTPNSFFKRWHSLKKFVFLIPFIYSLKIGYANFQNIQQQKYPRSLQQNEEIQIWKHQLSNALYSSIIDKSLYIDDPQAGRFYTILNSRYAAPFPCPYFVYFYTPQTTLDSILAKRVQLNFYRNFNKQEQFLTSNPPEFIVRGTHSGFINNQLKLWHDAHYTSIDTISYQHFTFVLSRKTNNSVN